MKIPNRKHLCIFLFINTLLFLLFNLTIATAQDTTYLNSNWDKCKKVESIHFRTFITTTNGYNVCDFYSQGLIYMKAFSKSKDSLNLEGNYDLFYENGVLKETGTYKSNLLAGKCIQYFENGKMKREAELVEGKYNGSMVYYDKKGNVIGRGQCKDDGWDGLWIKYEENGQTSHMFYGNTQEIKDLGIRFTSDKYIWLSSEQSNDSSEVEYFFRCQAPISQRKKLVSNPPVIHLYHSKINGTYENYFVSSLKKTPYVFELERKDIELIEAYTVDLDRKDKGSVKDMCLRLKLKGEVLFLICQIGSEEYDPKNMEIILEFVKNISTL